MTGPVSVDCWLALHQEYGVCLKETAKQDGFTAHA
jgi:hypothetical protein